MKLDILAFGAHPDDVEMSAAGTLAAEIKKGKKVGIIDFTAGELGTRGTAETRREEAQHAAQILGVNVRENLEFRDGFFTPDEQHVLQLVNCIRKYQPQIVLCNAPEDRHPDHGRAAKMVVDACFLSGLRKIETTGLAAWRPSYVFHYIQDKDLTPHFYLDVSHTIHLKMESILAYKTQFYNPNLNEPLTYISQPTFLEALKGRNRIWGKQIGVEYAEGFISTKNLGITGFDALICNAT